MQLAQFGLHLLAQVLVERAKRLVQKPRLGDDGAGKRDALALAARKLARHALCQRLDAHKLQHFIDPPDGFGLRDLHHLQAEADIVAHAHMGKERVLLEHHGGAAPLRRDPQDRLPVKRDIVPVGRDEACNRLQQVVLPQPDGPRRASTSHFSTVREMSSTANTPPAYVFLMPSISRRQEAWPAIALPYFATAALNSSVQAP